MIKKTTSAEKNKLLKQAFKKLELDPEQVWNPCPDDLDLENHQLANLLDWTYAYRKHPDRELLEKQGYHYPPVEPDFNPDNDWLIFETWVQGKPVRWKFEDEFGKIMSPKDLADHEVADQMGRLVGRLAERGVSVEYQDGIPFGLAYSELCKYLMESEFEILIPGVICHLTGCTGYCPDCFQRPWCEMGQECSWPEDKEAGTMAIPEACKPYVQDNDEPIIQCETLIPACATDTHE